MRKRKKLYPYGILGAIGLLILSFFIYITDPSYSFKVLIFTVPLVFCFFVLSIVSLYGVFSFAFLNRRRGLILSLFLNSILLLRYFGFKSLLYSTIVFLIFALIEYSFSTHIIEQPRFMYWQKQKKDKTK
jgi:hypothetical protein